MKLLKQSLLALATATALFSTAASACTGIELKAQNGDYISGRTLEFGIPINTVIMVVPRNYSFVGALPNNQNGMQFSSKYAFVGGSLDNGTEAQDGMNEAGLSVGAFYFPGYASYANINSQNQDVAVSPLQFPTWILSSFSNVEEVKAAIQANKVAIAPTVFQSWGIVPPLHYVVYDKTGKSIVIEPLNGKLVVSDNPLGIMANSPTFEWHMTNLRNYINLSPVNVSPIQVSGLELQQFSQGSGMHGLPGDFTSPSRFVRVAFFAATAIPQANAEQEVQEVFHILNQFDIPMGAVRQVQNGKMAPEYTMITIVRDPDNLKYYYKTYQNQDINVVNLNSFDLNAKTIKRLDSSLAPQEVTDVSGSLQ